MNKTNAAKNAAVTAVMATILICSKFALIILPNIEIITFLIIIFTCVFGFKRVIFSVLIFCLLDNFLYSFSYLVAIQYFFHWPLLCLLTQITYNIFKSKLIPYVVLALFFAILFWIETPAIYTILKFMPFFPSLFAGFLFMIPMAISGFVTVLFGYIPLYYILIKIKNKIFIN